MTNQRPALKRDFFALIIVLASAIASAAQTADDCSLKKDQDGIKVWSCAQSQQRFKLIRATFTVNASLDEFASIISDVADYKTWQYRTTESTTIKRMDRDHLIYHIVVSAPWPISNRDLVVQFAIVKDTLKHVIHVTANSVPSYIPAIAGLVRVPASTSQWTVTAMDSTTLSIEYSILIDPGGAVPAWMVNMVAADAPFESFQRLRNRISERRNGR